MAAAAILYFLTKLNKSAVYSRRSRTHTKFYRNIPSQYLKTTKC